MCSTPFLHTTNSRKSSSGLPSPNHPGIAFSSDAGRFTAALSPSSVAFTLFIFGSYLARLPPFRTFSAPLSSCHMLARTVSSSTSCQCVPVHCQKLFCQNCQVRVHSTGCQALDDTSFCALSNGVAGSRHNAPSYAAAAIVGDCVKPKGTRGSAFASCSSET